MAKLGSDYVSTKKEGAWLYVTVGKSIEMMILKLSWRSGIVLCGEKLQVVSPVVFWVKI
jgi:hypothetical protein